MAWWKIWRKKDDIKKVKTDPFSLAAFLYSRLSNHEMPFYGWQPNDLVIPEKIAGIVDGAVCDYIIYLYLDLIRQKFGDEIQNIVKENLLIGLNRESDLGETTDKMLNYINNCLKNKSSLLSLVPNEEYKLAMQFLLSEGSPYNISDDTLKNFEQYGMPENYFENTDTILSECLRYAKVATCNTFRPLLDHIEFKSESINGLNVYYNQFYWSDIPGCFERHLQRRYNSPLFSPNRRTITQQEIDVAKSKDLEDLECLIIIIKNIVDSSSKLRNDEAIQELMNSRIELLEKLELRAMEIGGDIDPIINIINNERTSFINSYRAAISENKELLEHLNKDEDFYHHGYHNALCSFIAQIQREDTPILPEEFTATLLSENNVDIKKIVECYVNMNLLDNLRTTILSTLIEMTNRNERHTFLKEKLLLIGIDLQNLQKFTF